MRRQNGDTFSVFIEIDSGGGRAGLPYPELPGLLDIARVLHNAPGVELAGVMTHAGHSYHESTPDGIAAVAEQERLAIVGAAEKLRAAGIPCPIVSAGSTPTAMHSRDFTGITEMRPGVYVLQRSRPGVHRLVRRRRSRALGAGLGDRPLPASQPGADRCRRAGALQGHQRPGIPAQGRLRHDRRCAGQGHGGDRLLAGARLRRRRTIRSPTATCRSAAACASCPTTPASPRRPTTVTTSSTASSTAARQWSTSTTASTAGDASNSLSA